MGSVYRRKDSPNWWLAYLDVSGKRCLKSAETTEESVARERLAEIERSVQAQKSLGLKSAGPLTVAQWLERWTNDRRGRLSSADEVRKTLERHMLPIVGDMAMTDVRTPDIQRVIDEAMKHLSSRTVVNLHGSMRTMFKAALKRGLVSVQPCVLSIRDGELPRPRDAKRGWRASAVFTREEMSRLIYDERLKESHRVLWALLFLGAMRIGEAVARRWSDIEIEQPLPKLHVRSSYNAKHRTHRLGGKTGIDRQVPILPQLGAILEHWRDVGRPVWVAEVDRPWRKKAPAEDFIIPGPRGGVLSGNTTWRWLQNDLETLGLRPRRQHDTRRTFYSLASADGARPDIVELVVWGLDPSVASQYLTMPWASVCAEISKLRLPTFAEATATPRYAAPNHP